MSFADRLDGWTRGARGPALAALVAVLAALPGFFAMPVLDRDEARFAQASAQMLETRDFTTINFQAEPRFKKPVGIYWLQAISTAVFSSAEARDIRTYRIPSLLGAALAAAACAWGAAAFLRPGLAFTAGALMASTVMLSTEAFIAKTDALLCGLITLALAALGKLYLASQESQGQGPPVRWMTHALFWLAIAGTILIKGPVGPMVVALTLIALAIWDRKIAWIGRLRWDWGLIIVAAIVGPWALAITVTTDGSFWTTAVAGDLAPKLAGGQESHGAPPGYYALLSPILMYPASLLLPAAAVLGWQRRADPAVRFALCWLIPTWIAFELIPTKLFHYTLPVYGAAAWLMASALAQPMGRISRIAGIGFLALGGAALCVAAFLAAHQFGGTGSMVCAALVIVLTSAAVWLAAGRLQRGQAQAAALTAGVIGILVHSVVVGFEAPSLRGIWLSERAATAVRARGLDPRQDIVAGPIAVAGYAEPSLVFLLGTPIQLTDAAGAARALASGRPALVEERQEAAVRALYPAMRPPVANVRGLNYSNGRRLTLYLHPPAPQIIPRPPTPARAPVTAAPVTPPRPQPVRP